MIVDKSHAEIVKLLPLVYIETGDRSPPVTAQLRMHFKGMDVGAVWLGTQHPQKMESQVPGRVGFKVTDLTRETY